MSAVDLGAPALLIAAAWVWVTYIRSDTRLELQRREHELRLAYEREETARVRARAEARKGAA